MRISLWCYSVQEKLVLEIFVFKQTLHKMLLSANQTLALSLIYHVHDILFIPPSVGVVGLAEYVLYSPHSLFLQRKIQTLCPTTLSRGTVLHPALPVDWGHP